MPGYRLSRVRREEPGWERIEPNHPRLAHAIREMLRSPSGRHRAAAMLSLPDDPRGVASRGPDALVRTILRYVSSGRAHVYRSAGLPAIPSGGGSGGGGGNGGGGGTTPTPPTPTEPPTEDIYVDTLQIDAITFTSDFASLLKDNTADWKDTGTPYPEPEWTPGQSHPIVQAMNTPVSLKVEGTVTPDGALPRNGTLKATAGGLKFETASLTFSSGKFTATLTSDKPLPEEVQKLSLKLSWSIEGGPVSVSPGSTSTDLFVTYARPRDDLAGSRQEDGVTHKRMENAVDWVGGAGTLSPHGIVAALMKKFPYYQLSPSPNVPAKFRHPTYLRQTEGGAWPMADYVAETGECQAIVRTIRANIRQVGVPGDANVYVVWSEPHVDGGKTAVEADWEADPSSGLNTQRTVNGKVQLAALADGPVVVGRDYPPSHSPMPNGGGYSPGLNRYEACLKFTAEGTTKYYGGGAGTYASKDEVILAFWGLVWVSIEPGGAYHVHEIVHTYR